MLATSFLIVVAWIVGVVLAAAVWGAAAYLIFWTWRKTNGSTRRRASGLIGLAVFFFFVWAASRVVP
jgi:hypothetical protein